MNLLQSLFGWLTPAPRPITSRKTSRPGHEYRALVHLVAHGKITLADIRGNHPAKVVLRMRKSGYVKTSCHDEWKENPKTGRPYKVYVWTGKLPVSWITGPHYTGMERRTKTCGCRVERRHQ